MGHVSPFQLKLSDFSSPANAGIEVVMFSGILQQAAEKMGHFFPFFLETTFLAAKFFQPPLTFQDEDPPLTPPYRKEIRPPPDARKKWDPPYRR